MGLDDCCGFVGLDWWGVVSFGFCSLFGLVWNVVLVGVLVCLRWFVLVVASLV